MNTNYHGTAKAAQADAKAETLTNGSIVGFTAKHANSPVGIKAVGSVDMAQFTPDMLAELALRSARIDGQNAIRVSAGWKAPSAGAENKRARSLLESLLPPSLIVALTSESDADKREMMLAMVQAALHESDPVEQAAMLRAIVTPPATNPRT